MIYLLVDLGFGDSGKGSIVDYLLSQCKGKTLIVRYCGGYQAAHHTVSGVRRRYSQFGAGSLQYENVDTYLGPNFIFSPTHLEKEFHRNKSLPVYEDKRIYVDPNCLVATNIARSLNKFTYENNKSVATCGGGIGVTRKYWLDYGSDAIIAADLASSSYARKMELMRQRIHPYFYDTEIFDNYSHVYRVGVPNFSDYSNIIFEGSQGVLLDENYGVGAPEHATWSTTTLLHAYQLIKEHNLKGEMRKIGILRAYHTRHGSGPFQEDSGLTKRLAPLEVDNKSDGLQGSFKFSYINPYLIEYALNIPLTDVEEVAVTCLDHLTRNEADTSLQLISHFKPISIQSWGPSAGDKR